MKSFITISFLIASLGIFSGCSTTEEVITPDGYSRQLVTCTLERDCYADSAKVCRGKYKILNRRSENVSSEGSESHETKFLIQCESAQ